MILSMAVITLVCCAVYLYNKWCHSYWCYKGVKCPPGTFLLGHMHLAFFSGEARQKYYDEFFSENPSLEFSGHYEFFKPILNIYDPKLIRAVLVKDFDSFVDRRDVELGGGRGRVFNEMLMTTKGHKWKTLRQHLIPMFSSGKLKLMFLLIQGICHDLVRYCKDKSCDGTVSVDMNKAFMFFALDVIASCGFGILPECLQNDDAEFGKKAVGMLKPSARLLLNKLIYMVMPKVALFLSLEVVGEEMGYFSEAVKSVLTERRKTGKKRNDFLDFFLDLEKSDKNNFDFSHATILAESCLLLRAGFQTVFNSMAFTAYLLAKHKDVQSNLRRKLQNMCDYDGDILYDDLIGEKYLESCIYGTNIQLTRGTLVRIPIWKLHHDAKYWPQPERYLPERFLENGKANKLTFLAFGNGPRHCIGIRFALMEIKLAIATLVLNFELSLSEDSEEVKLSKRHLSGFTTAAAHWPKLFLEELVANY